MEIKIKKIRAIFLLISSLFLTGCMKEFLDVKNDRSLIVPSELKDFRALMDNSSLNLYSSHMMGQIGSDEYYLEFDRWNLLTIPAQKNGYIWAEDVYEGQPIEDWGRAYEKILISNIVLEGLEEINEKSKGTVEYNNLKGTALFFRAQSYFYLAQLFCQQYDPETASDALGLPLKLSSNIHDKLPRATLEETYERILKDMHEALTLLPKTEIFNTRPTTSAANAMLAKIYLQMGRFENAYDHSAAVLVDRPELIDYNSIDAELTNPFPRYAEGNKEVILHGTINMVSSFSPAIMNVDSNLYSLYHENDLRKKIFFYDNNGVRAFKGSYEGSIIFFTGLTTSETLLIRAECHARLGDISSAMDDINLLLKNRFVSGTYVDILDATRDEVLAIILEERRKELVFRGVRWHDLKRLSREPQFAVTLKRILDGNVYELEPGDRRWVWQIPPDVLSLGGIEPNVR